MVTPYGLMFGGVASAVLPLAPFPGAEYLRGWLQRQPHAALLWYALAVLGCLWGAVSFMSRQPQLQWAIGLGLALSWWFLATETAQQRQDDAQRQARGAPDKEDKPDA